jgi:dUTP pyrophosphatase
MSFQVQLLSDNATLPTKGSKLAAGWDLYASQDFKIEERGSAMVDTDIAVAIPDGMYGRIADRSSLAAKYCLSTGGGVVDADYRGHVKVVLFNHSENDYEGKKGDRIAQIILTKISHVDIKQVNNLNDTKRGTGGFGSTGK